MRKQTAIREAKDEASRFRCAVAVVEVLNPRRGEARFFPCRPEWLDTLPADRRDRLFLVGEAGSGGGFQTEW